MIKTRTLASRNLSSSRSPHAGFDDSGIGTRRAQLADVGVTHGDGYLAVDEAGEPIRPDRWSAPWLRGCHAASAVRNSGDTVAAVVQISGTKSGGVRPINLSHLEASLGISSCADAPRNARACRRG